jgi:hypothetical protein
MTYNTNFKKINEKEEAGIALTDQGVGVRVQVTVSFFPSPRRPDRFWDSQPPI